MTTAAPAVFSPPPAATPLNFGHYRGNGLQAMWAAVVGQALEDVAAEGFGSREYSEAVAFFISPGWLVSRQEIADMLDCHADDIERVGRRAINARLLAKGLPALAPKNVKPAKRIAGRPAAAPAPKPPLPRLVAEFRPKPEIEPRRGGWTKRWTRNPFDPFRIPEKLPSEVRAKARAA